MKVTPLALREVLLIEARAFGDTRGYFMESWQAERYAKAGINGPFVQDNLSLSSQHTLRGLHLQHPHGQGKLVQVLLGEVFDVAVDVRRGSPTFGRWVGERLSADNHMQLYVPPGFAHGFWVLSDKALFAYKCTELYDAPSEFSVCWNDPDLGINWPDGTPQLSEKDTQAPRLRDIPTESLPPYTEA
jgi:dTDP-4-dehydrorhamnose 3,5-epimerase